MNIACFRIHLQQTKNLLSKMNILAESNINAGHFEPSDETKKAGHGTDYYELYECVARNYDYEFRLNDGSYFQMAYINDGLRYAFLESVSEAMSFEDYCFLEGLSDDQVKDMNEEEYVVLRECYEVDADSLKKKTHPLYIRYDYTRKLEEHIPNVHSSSHFHFGWDNNSRIPCSRILTPESFACFSIKMYSPSIWKTLLEKEILNEEDYSFKKLLEDLPKDLWVVKELRDLFIS